MTAPCVFHLRIPMEPVGQGRPRATRRGGLYTPPGTRAAMRTVREAAAAVWGEHPPLEGPLQLALLAACRRCKGAKTRHGTHWPTKKPDLTNIIKLVEDALNGLVYHDDAQIVVISAGKTWADEPSITVLVSPIGDQIHATPENLHTPES